MQRDYLDKLPEDERTNLMRQFLYEPYPGDRRDAARMIASYEVVTPEILEDLVSRLKDPSNQVRDAAKWALLKAARNEEDSRPKWADRDNREASPAAFALEHYKATIALGSFSLGTVRHQDEKLYRALMAQKKRHGLPPKIAGSSENYLSQANETDSSPIKDIFEAKPGVFGFSIDLIEVLRRLREGMKNR